ncbi:MAG TPA: methyltransferase domain-containing protein [Bacteroidota bacterium]
MLKRRYDPEIMDDFSIQDERMDLALGELKLVNRFLGGKATTQKGLRLIREGLSPPQALSVLDVGAGGGDVLDDAGVHLNLTVLDRNPGVCRYLKRHSRASVICGDAMHLSFRDRSFDIVHASLFLHHLREEEIRRMLVSCLRICRRGIIINDLRRSVFAYAGIKILATLFSKSFMVKHDGPLSVLRGFSRNDLETLLADVGVTQYALQRRWAFRWLIVIWK